MIEFLDERRPESTVVELVGGPRDGERVDVEQLHLPGTSADEGSYVRSVQCADDGALRYVWHPSEKT